MEKESGQRQEQILLPVQSVFKKRKEGSQLVWKEAFSERFLHKSFFRDFTVNHALLDHVLLINKYNNDFFYYYTILTHSFRMT